MIKAIIIDDEPFNIDNLSYLLQAYCPEVQVVASTSNPEEGTQLVRLYEIDVLFLDIQMPKKNGFELLIELGQYNFQVIFVTAYDSYAIQAIKYSAFDYLLKPIDIDELVNSVKRVSATIRQSSDNQIKHLLNLLQEGQKEPKSIAIQLMNEIRFVNFTDIVRCQSENNYTIFFLADSSKLTVSKGMYEYENLLSRHNFIRCHQSHIVNKAFVKSILKDATSYNLKMKDNTVIPVARSKKDIVKESLMKDGYNVKF